VATLLQALEYKTRESRIHDLDPRTKICFSAMITFSSIISKDLTLLIVLQAISLILAWYAGVLKAILKGIKNFIYFLVLIAVINIMLFSLGFSLIMLIKFLVIISVFSLFLMVTPSDQILQVMEWMKLPVEIVIGFSIAFRYVSIMVREARLILDAQMARGLDFQKGSIIKKIKGYVYLLIPLVVLSTRRAVRIAESMEARGFGARKKRTQLYELKMRRRDYMIIALVCLLSSLIFLLEFSFGLPPWMTINVPP